MAFEYFPPQLGKGEYHCPYCNVYAKQFYAHLCTFGQFEWSSVVDRQSKFNSSLPHNWIVTRCQHCENFALWIGDNLVHPKRTIAPPPNDDLLQSIKDDYLEAASILSDSPRAAAALLRLALQKLCVQLGEKGVNINQDIKALVVKGLNPLVQKSLDALRITGNNAVHPGEINLSEQPERVIKLFDLINFIANKLITEPHEIEGFYEALPPDALSAVEQRDRNPQKG
ncbi:DUF4145 domain-containing protein [Pseudolysobacter antarcticus]|uniref:DUF4145 domain-containing protein n=1 Tax=Pseudolysobacter antarcticus TaxID=2511995 RepID=A0A411HKE2_9GAMM|nr:DUF4145 domain-containing protein [Pseudolysobacter antarcticus]QBB70992.1 DUF4145 domain-containing protein [Pseudolysobacter antarcticus]